MTCKTAQTMFAASARRLVTLLRAGHIGHLVAAEVALLMRHLLEVHPECAEDLAETLFYSDGSSSIEAAVRRLVAAIDSGEDPVERALDVIDRAKDLPEFPGALGRELAGMARRAARICECGESAGEDDACPACLERMRRQAEDEIAAQALGLLDA